MLPNLVADHQIDWYQLLLHAVATHDSNVSRITGLVPNEAHAGPCPRLSTTFSEGSGVGGQQGLKRDQLDYLASMRGRKEKACNLVRRQERLIKARHQTENEGLDKILHRKAKWNAGDWV